MNSIDKVRDDVIIAPRKLKFELRNMSGAWGLNHITSTCHKIIKHALKILWHLLEDFNVRYSIKFEVRFSIASF